MPFAFLPFAPVRPSFARARLPPARCPCRPTPPSPLSPSSSSSSSSSSSPSSSSSSSSSSSPPPSPSSAAPSPDPPNPAPPTPPPPTAPPRSDFRHRFDHLRGKPVEPVSATMARFNSLFARPIPIVYRSVVNEMLTTTHLAVVCAMWRSDPVFAYGFDSIFSVFLRYYPDPSERDQLYHACARALQLDPAAIKSTAAAVTAWLQDKTEHDLFAALNAAPPAADADTVGPVIEALAYIRDAADFDWYYSRLFGIGLIQIMSSVGVQLSVANAEKWANAIGLMQSKFTAEMGAYLSNMERLKQAEQIFAEAAAREAKNTAERLAARAKAAAQQADQLERLDDPPQQSDSPSQQDNADAASA